MAIANTATTTISLFILSFYRGRQKRTTEKIKRDS